MMRLLQPLGISLQDKTNTNHYNTDSGKIKPPPKFFTLFLLFFFVVVIKPFHRIVSLIGSSLVSRGVPKNRKIDPITEITKPTKFNSHSFCVMFIKTLPFV